MPISKNNNMKFLSKITVASLLLLSFTSCASGLKNTLTETVKISGNCGMCETTIEHAGNKKKEVTLDWNRDTKLAVLMYDSVKTNRDEILKRVALSGYDNQSFRADDKVYSSLPECCQYTREIKGEAAKQNGMKDDSAHQMDEKMIETAHNQFSEVQNKNQLNSIYENYFVVKDALVSTNGKTASSNAKVLLDNLTAVKMSTLSEEEHIVWMSVKDDLIFNAKHIFETKDASHQRDHFDALSKGMYKLMKASKYDTTVYYQFCPMAMDGKGANWLSKDKEIKNPYYGSQMLSCGKTVETLK
jgi:hypothetical protein